MLSIVQILSAPKHIHALTKGEAFPIPSEVQDLINVFWNEVNQTKQFTRGRVYTIKEWSLVSERLEIELMETDYAHYLYTIRKEISEKLACRVLFASALIETSDGKWVIGEMAEHTSNPGRYQLVGGGIDEEDIKNGIIDLENNIRRECSEEIGLQIDDHRYVETFYPKYLKTGGEYGFITLIYNVKLCITSQELQQLYFEHVQALASKREKPEFKQLLFIPSNLQAVVKFSQLTHPKEEFLDRLLQIEAGLAFIDEIERI